MVDKTDEDQIVITNAGTNTINFYCRSDKPFMAEVYTDYGELEARSEIFCNQTLQLNGINSPAIYFIRIISGKTVMTYKVPLCK